MGVACPTFTSLDEMLDKAKPTHLMVTTVDASHADCIVKALKRGINVITEKPMVIDEKQCRAVLDAERAAGKQIVVTFNYRYAPKHQKIKEVLMSGEIGRITSVDFSWYLDTTHGADYFRRWHRLREKSGSLWVHKATHHFDLINWWLDADPVEVARLRAASRTTARTARSGTRTAAPARTSEVRVLLGHHEGQAAERALRRLRVGRRLPPRRLRLQGGHQHLRHDERGRPLLERRAT